MAGAAVDVRWMGPEHVDAVLAAGHLFDDVPRAGDTRRFLDEPTHHLAVAHVGDVPAGFVTGVEITHPDKGTEMLLYELGVAEAFRGRGIGRALVASLAERAREVGCVGMWVATEPDNEAALATYRAAGAGAPEPHVVLEWRFDDGA